MEPVSNYKQCSLRRIQMFKSCHFYSVRADQTKNTRGWDNMKLIQIKSYSKLHRKFGQISFRFYQVHRNTTPLEKSPFSSKCHFFLRKKKTKPNALISHHRIFTKRPTTHGSSVTTGENRSTPVKPAILDKAKMDNTLSTDV